MNYGIEKFTAIPVVLTSAPQNSIMASDINDANPLPIDLKVDDLRYSFTGTLASGGSATHIVAGAIDAEKIIVCLQYSFSAAGSGTVAVRRAIYDANGVPLALTPVNDETYTFNASDSTAASLVKLITVPADELHVVVQNTSGAGVTLTYSLTVVVLK